MKKLLLLGLGLAALALVGASCSKMQTPKTNPPAAMDSNGNISSLSTNQQSNTAQTNAAPAASQPSQFVASGTMREVRLPDARLVQIRDLNLYVGGKLVVKNIPQSFGLSTGDKGNDSSILTHDFFSDILVAPEGDSFAVLYEKLRDDTDMPSSVLTHLLVFSLDGALLSKGELKMKDGAYVTQDLLYFSKNRVAVDDYGCWECGYRRLVIMEHGREVSNFLEAGMQSPDKRYLIYLTNQDAGIQTCGMGGIALSELRLLDFSTNTDYLIAKDLAKGFDPQNWSADGKSVLVLIGGKDSASQEGCVKYTNFAVLNLANRKLEINQGGGTLPAQLKQICAGKGFDCKNVLDYAGW